MSVESSGWSILSRYMYSAVSLCMNLIFEGEVRVSSSHFLFLLQV